MIGIIDQAHSRTETELPMVGGHIKDIQFVWDGSFIPGGGTKFILQIFTDLQLNPQHKDFDFQAIQDVIASVKAYKDANNRQFDDYRLISVADGQV